MQRKLQIGKHMSKTVKALICGMGGLVVWVGADATAWATDYRCHLPTVTYSTVENGAPKTETTQDDTVTFTIKVENDNKSALVDGFRFDRLKLPGQVTFVGLINAAAKGMDVITIYDVQVGGGQYTVESRQMTILSHPSASQLAGVCVAS